MAFQIIVQPSALQFEAQADETLLGAAIRQGVGLPYGCRDGACGSCKCRKLSGEVTLGPHQSKALSEQEQHDGLILACCATAQSDVVLESKQVVPAGEFPIKKMPARISELDRLNDDVIKLRLQLPANETFQYRAGQYVEFLLRDGDRRSYSMANAPHTQGEQPGVELHLRHMPGGKFTDQVFGSMKVRDIVRIEGPYGSFFLREDSDAPMVWVASGTGFAPIKALLEHMMFRDIKRPTTLYWGGRRPHDLYLHDWVEQTVAQLPHVRYIPVVSDATAEDAWQGRTGFVHRAVLEDFADLSGYQVYACGAPIVVDSARHDFVQQRGLPEEAFFADSFTSAADSASN